MTDTTAEKWDITITSGRGYLRFDVKELWRYRDLLMMFVKKDIITVYKQTILGPIWFVIQPVLTTIMFVFVFANIAKLSTDGVPQQLFYLANIIMWGYFSETLNITSRTFTDNASIFGKVYFPRLILPMSKVVSGLAKFFIQFGLFLVVWLYYLYTQRSLPFVERTIHPNIYLALVPLLVLIMAMISLGFGLFITSMTTKYRDLSFLIVFGVQLAMYITPVIYPLSSANSPLKQLLLKLNPLTSLFETFRYAFLGHGIYSTKLLLYSTVFAIVLLLAGILVFNRVEKRFIDTV